jgi:hypothetical protein
MRLGEVLGKSETTSRSEWIAGAQVHVTFRYRQFNLILILRFYD